MRTQSKIVTHVEMHIHPTQGLSSAPPFDKEYIVRARSRSLASAFQPVHALLPPSIDSSYALIALSCITSGSLYMVPSVSYNCSL